MDFIYKEMVMDKIKDLVLLEVLPDFYFNYFSKSNLFDEVDLDHVLVLALVVGVPQHFCLSNRFSALQHFCLSSRSSAYLSATYSFCPFLSRLASFSYNFI